MLIQPYATQQTSQFFVPFEDEAITFAGTASGLTADKVSRCRAVVIRFTGGDGKLRITGQSATATDGFDVFAGDTVTMSRPEAERLSGIRAGATNLTGWATYYQ